ncbi:hypothetical protein V6N11_074174 [Hibiscus sabdariffa]|uniref:Reverse transcriptase domain-containing protein n=1 Tax=Hibiscus sabdariffa TaxID=183260 RepID=A0ABR2NWI5_9ROSI
MTVELDDQQRVWNSIKELLHASTLPWCIGRDFNAATSLEERVGCQGSVRGEWIEKFGNLFQMSLNRGNSDHALVQLSTTSFERVEDKISVTKLLIEELDARVGHGENSMEREFEEDEIRRTVWRGDGSKAPDPDGFTFEIYKRCWSFVKGDILNIFNFFYAMGRLPSGLNSTFVVLVLKNDNPTVVNVFIPNCVLNSDYKILAKVLAARFQEVANSLIKDAQTTFLKGRQIVVGVLLVNEVVHSLRHDNSFPGSVLLNLDYVKAYDCLNWKFLDHILERMGCGVKWREWVGACVRTT